MRKVLCEYRLLHFIILYVVNNSAICFLIQLNKWFDITKLPTTSVLVIEIIVFVPFGDVFNCFSLLLVSILPLYSIFDIFRDLLVNNRFRLSSYDIETCTVLLNYILGSHIAIHFFHFVVASKGLASMRFFIGVTDWIIAETKSCMLYPLEFLLFSI